MKLELKEVLAGKLNARRKAEGKAPVEPASMTEEQFLSEAESILRALEAPGGAAGGSARGSESVLAGVSSRVEALVRRQLDAAPF